jgi:hypothetical protein
VPGSQRLGLVAAFCRIGLDRPVPHPTTLVKLVRRAGPELVEELNAALLGKPKLSVLFERSYALTNEPIGMVGQTPTTWEVTHRGLPAHSW